jgi:hypothetical protein
MHAWINDKHRRAVQVFPGVLILRQGWREEQRSQ